MKNIKTTIHALAVLLVAAVAATACSSGDDDAVPGGSPAGINVYTQNTRDRSAFHFLQTLERTN